MTDITAQSEARSSFGRLTGRIVEFFASIGDANERVREAERLRSMSDEELAQRGLRREDIARHVFRDLFYI